jgi:hypothetical protein
MVRSPADETCIEGKSVMLELTTEDVWVPISWRRKQIQVKLTLGR